MVKKERTAKLIQNETKLNRTKLYSTKLGGKEGEDGKVDDGSRYRCHDKYVELN
jgi:hypothetical protein